MKERWGDIEKIVEQQLTRLAQSLKVINELFLENIFKQGVGKISPMRRFTGQEGRYTNS